MAARKSKEVMAVADKYTYRVAWSEEDQEHVGLCAEFPSLSWLEKSAEDAFSGIRRLVMDTLKDMQVLQSLQETGRPPWAVWQTADEPA